MMSKAFDGPVDIQILALLRRSPCRVSDTKAMTLGALVYLLVILHCGKLFVSYLNSATSSVKGSMYM